MPKVVFFHRTGRYAGMAQILSTVDDALKELGAETMPIEFPFKEAPPDSRPAVFVLLKATNRALYFTELLAPAGGLSEFHPAQT